MYQHRTLLFTILISSLVWTGCAKQYIRVFETQAENVAKAGDQWVFENDMVRIRYSFWAEGGVMSFAIYNKTSRPLFVDWKNSALVLNDHRLVYWIDETLTSNVTTTRGSSSTALRYQPATYFDWGYVLGSTTNFQSTAISEGSMVRDERITSIPPHAYVGMQKHELLSGLIDLNTHNCEQVVERRNDHPAKSTVVLLRKFQQESSPVRFRNFLIFSMTEDMKDPFQIDNSFWLSEARQMDYRHFRGRYQGRDAANKPVYPKPFKTRTSFYWRFSK